jgi:hypothetical protein
MALKEEVFAFATRENIYTEVRQCREEIEAMSETESDTTSEECESEDDGSEEAEHVDEESFTEDSFCISVCDCVVCDGMNTVKGRWETWQPDTPLEVSLYNAINKSEMNIITC